MNMIFERKLEIPMEVKKRFPVSKEMEQTVEKRQAELQSIFRGESGKLILVIGPCSADRADSVLDYIGRLRLVQDKVADKIFIIPRIYTNKPRTSGDGYKGLLHQPDPNEKPDLYKGIIATRDLHMRAVRDYGFSCADEMLYPENHKYLDDLLAYVAVGARSVEDQQHRLTASGIEVPVGMKNPTSGDFSIMMNAIRTAQHKHTFIYRGWAAHSLGNPYAHAILRGYTNKHGNMLPNYHYEDLMKVYELYQKSDLVNPALLIDTNHANSGKDPFEQPRIVREVLTCRKYNADLKGLIKGFMVESYLEDGNQPVGGKCYGKSITDACLGWDKTERLIYDIAEML
ncbi:MAG: 3-deoxy-7-phosphoheptulonate synthase [Clostridia bacterium]|nr:3-deoxy-7-phosphoheptulonate synthase [Clostridia bacterium]